MSLSGRKDDPNIERKTPNYQRYIEKIILDFAWLKMKNIGFELIYETFMRLLDRFLKFAARLPCRDMSSARQGRQGFRGHWNFLTEIFRIKSI